MARKWVAVEFGGPEVLRNIEVAVPDPGHGQVTVDVRAVGMNPADAKHIAPGQDRRLLPLSMGYEVAGVVTALGPETELASGGGAIGDEVVASQVVGGYTTAITASASSVFAMPSTLTFPEAANLLLVGTTAADLLHTSGAEEGETVLLHGAAGAVGVSVLQQARLLGARVVGTAGQADFDFVRRFGGIPVEYGPGLPGGANGGDVHVHRRSGRFRGPDQSAPTGQDRLGDRALGKRRARPRRQGLWLTRNHRRSS
jgi:NADPH:quinone reductase